MGRKKREEINMREKLLWVLLLLGSLSSSFGELKLVNRHSGLRLAKRLEVDREYDSVLGQMGDWHIAVFKDGRILGSGYGGKIVELDPNSGAGHEIAVLGEFDCINQPTQRQLFSKDNFGEASVTHTYCRFEMEARQGYRVRLTFFSFSSNPSERCDNDRIFVKDTDEKKIKKFCGKSQKSVSVLSSGNTLVFELDSFQESSQFFAIWEEVQDDFVEQKEGNHLISFPHTLIENSTEKVCIDLFSTRNERGAGLVSLKVFTKEDLISENIEPKFEDSISFSSDENRQCHPIAIPSIKNTTKAFINFDASFDNPSYAFNVFKEIQILPKETYNLIQTDKGQYKPNDTVKFRIILLDDALKPAQISNIDEIWIEDTNNNRIKQWRSLPLNKGMLQQEFTLSEEPTLGSWSIKFKSGNLQEKTIFKVAEYVLPKFQVKIELTTTILKNFKEIIWKVCGTYTHGGSVKGVVRWNITGIHIQPSISNTTYVESGQDCALVQLSSKNWNYSPYRSIQGNTISLEVEFEEDGTGTKILESWTGSVLSKEFTLTGTNSPNKFTVGGFPYIGGFRSTHHDGTPAVEILLQLCWNTNVERTEKCQTGYTDVNGDYKFYIPSSGMPANAQTMTIVAKAVDYLDDMSTGMNQPQSKIDIELNQMKSSKSIMIENNGHRKLSCNDQFQATVYASSNDPELFDMHYYIISKGKLFKTGKVEVDPLKDDQVLNSELTDGAQRLNVASFYNQIVNRFVTKKTIYIDIDHNVSPTMNLVVFSNEDENVTLIDSRIFKVDSCQNHEVDFKWSHTKVNPGTPMNISIRAESSSLCGISVTDKSVELLGNSNDVTQDKIAKLKEDIGQRKIPTNGEGCDAFSKMLQSSGISILSDLSNFQSCHTFKDAINIPDKVKEVSKSEKCRQGWIWNVYRKRCIRNRNSRRPSYEDESSAFSISDDYSLDEIVMNSDYDEYEGEDEVAYDGGSESAFSVQHSSMPRSRLDSASMPPLRGRNYLSISNSGDLMRNKQQIQLADLEKVTAKVEKPKVELRNYFPESWLFQLENTDLSGELTISTKSPHTITEWQGEAFCINDQQGLGVASSKSLSVVQDFFAEINLPYSVKRGEIVSLNISVFNKIQSQLPIYVEINANADDIMYDESNHQEVCVEAKDNSVVPFKIKALNLGNHDITASAKIMEGIPGCTNVEEGEGFTDALVRSLHVKPEGFPIEKVQTKLKCHASRKISSFDMATVYLPKNYVRDSERGWVQITGDVMAPALQNIEKLVSLPTGCGEQNMIGLVPNIYLLQYLDATNKREPEIREKAKSFMRIGYNRQQSYRHEDGSYSIWGKSKHNAHFRRGVDEGSTWLTAFVVKSFTMATKYIDVDRRLLQQSVDWLMEGQMENGCFRKSGYVHHKELAGGSSNASLTPFVFIALLEARSRLEVNLNGAGLMKAMDCMLENVNGSDAYTSVLTAYGANRLVELEEQFSISEQMKEKISQLWPHVIEMNPATASLHDPGSIFKRSLHTPKTEAVEMTAYNLMTLLMLKKAPEASKVVRWLAKQRNAQGGFISTQDTVVALQALSKYALKISSIKSDMSVKIIESHATKLHKNPTETHLNLTQDNALLLQSKKITQLPNKVTVVIEGEGCVMVQTVLRYNEHEKKKNKGFNLAIFNDDNEKMRICAEYTGNKEQTNMVVVEVEMVTGWEVYGDSVEELLNDVESRVRKYEIQEKENKLVLYFDDMPKQEHCIEMEVKLVTLVEEVKGAIASVYDYYDVEEMASIKYNM